MNERKVPIWAAAVAYLLSEDKLSAHYTEISSAVCEIIHFDNEDQRQHLQSVKTGLLKAEKEVGNCDSKGNRKKIRIFESSRDTGRDGVYSIFYGDSENDVDLGHLSLHPKVQEAIRALGCKKTAP